MKFFDVNERSTIVDEVVDASADGDEVGESIWKEFIIFSDLLKRQLTLLLLQSLSMSYLRSRENEFLFGASGVQLGAMMNGIEWEMREKSLVRTREIEMVQDGTLPA